MKKVGKMGAEVKKVGKTGAEVGRAEALGVSARQNGGKTGMLKRAYKYLLYILPLVLCFSYYPLIKIGENETMYFELSLPLIWLVGFDVVAFGLLYKEKRSVVFRKILGGLSWWLFPVFVLVSVFWSLNPVRGILTSGLLWLAMLAVAEIYELREYLDSGFWRVFWRWFLGAAMMVCGWCILQCILDVNGVPQAATLLCDGCTYKMFGFPHPNGFAIEPQFMGNLLLAPIMVGVWLAVSGEREKKPCGLGWAIWPILLILLLTLFLTFSRGAIYACGVGVIFLFSFGLFRAKRSERKRVGISILKTVGVFVVAFLFALNLQGILAASSPTTDTYGSGVAKVLNHLSLGLIDVRGETASGGSTESEGGLPASEGGLPASEVVGEVVENSEKTEGNQGGPENGAVENSGGGDGSAASESKANEAKVSESVFDGYVAESTDTRVRLTRSAVQIWRQDFKTMLIGVGIGGAGQALYNNGLSPAPREIVQNEYASLLLETGLVGVSLFVLSLILILRAVLKTKTAGLILGLMVAYAVSLLFFSGLPNALQIILLPGVLIYLQLHPRLVRRNS